MEVFLKQVMVLIGFAHGTVNVNINNGELGWRVAGLSGQTEEACCLQSFAARELQSSFLFIWS